MRYTRWMLLVAAVLGLAVGVSSCKKDDQNIPGPKISFVDQLTSNTEIKEVALAKKSVYVAVKTDDKTELEKIEYQFVGKSSSGESATKAKVEVKKGWINGGKKEASSPRGKKEYRFEVEIPADRGTYTELKLNISARDKAGNNAEKGIKVEIGGTNPTPNPDPKPVEGTKFGEEKTTGVVNHAHGAGTMGFNLKKGEKLNLDAVIATSENAYVLHNTSGNDSSFSPSITSGEVNIADKSGKKAKGNGTKFVKVTNVDYATVTVEDAKKAFDAGKADVTVSGLKKDEVIVAVHGKEIYLIKVTNVSMSGKSTRASVGFIEFNYKAGELK